VVVQAAEAEAEGEQALRVEVVALVVPGQAVRAAVLVPGRAAVRPCVLVSISRPPA
jgi:hypothetical protein